MANNELQKKSPEKKKESSGQLSMKWYDFLKDLGLYLYAVVVALMACTTIAGMTNAPFVAWLQEHGFGFMWTVDLVSCVTLFALAAYAVLIRFALVKKKAKAPVMLLSLHALDVVLNLVQLIITGNVAPKLNAIVPGMMQTDLFSSLMPIVGGLVLIFVNLTYFRKRKELFQN
jgi:hypothetical protein